MRAYVTEFIGIYFLVLTIGLTVLGGTPFAGLAIGASLMVMVYMGGHISGAHYNPAVSLACAIRKKLPWSEVPPYLAAAHGRGGGCAHGPRDFGADFHHRAGRRGQRQRFHRDRGAVHLRPHARRAQRGHDSEDQGKFVLRIGDRVHHCGRRIRRRSAVGRGVQSRVGFGRSWCTACSATGPWAICGSTSWAL